MTDPRPVVVSFTCPRCGMTSHNPTDAYEGYCGRCHDFTGDSAVLAVDPVRVSAVCVSDRAPHEYVPGAAGRMERPCRECGGFRLDPLHVLD